MKITETHAQERNSKKETKSLDGESGSRVHYSEVRGGRKDEEDKGKPQSTVGNNWSVSQHYYTF